jgi:Bacterial Ig-like domain (group 3)
MKSSRRLSPEVELCRSAAVMRKTLSPERLVPFFVLWGALLSLAPSGFAQAPNPPLNFGNNFFVTGDYIVAGAYGITSNFTTVNGVTYAVGTIAVPDSNPGITGTKQVPPGAQIVAALLYWQTAEKVGVTPGGSGSGQNGYFRPLLYSKSGGPAAPGYAISGTSLSGSNTVSWSSGGCGGSSTGKQLRTYRADVGGALPVDANGNPIANGSFEVRLPSVGNSTPLTLGATLIVIYRIPSGADGPNIPLNSIVIYDGDYSQNGAQLTMTQQLQGFYDAAHNPISRLTHIVGSGQSNKFQTVYLSSGTNAFVKLPFLYGNRLPAFPGYYGTWDNPTWTFNSASPITEDSSYATTQVVPSMSNQGCVSWGAVIVSTTVKNSDNDGILDSWKTDRGYCDASVNNGMCNGHGDPAWVDLTEAAKGTKDIFLQYDYMCSNVSSGSCVRGGNNYSFDPSLATDPLDNNETAVDKVVDAFENHPPFKLHVIPGNAILESQSSCADTDVDANGNLTCPFPNEPGTLGFREGVAYIKNQTIEPSTGLLGCDPTSDANPCVADFNHGKKDSYHYTLFSHGVGLPSWFLSDQSLLSVSQSGSTVTFTTSSPHGLSPIPGDSICSAQKGFIGRVSVVFAITNPNLEGTYCAKAASPPAANKFTITVKSLLPGTVLPSYTAKTDPNLAVANGQVTSMSGFSDVGGQNSVVSLGYGDWGPPSSPTSDGNTWQVKAGTFMHELGHTLGLTHGGTFYGGLGNKPPDYTPTFEPNCKPNSQSIMNYQFQVDLLTDRATGNQVLDYSKEDLSDLIKSSPIAPNFLNGPAYQNTAWFELTSFVQAQNPSLTPKVMSAHCDGSSRPVNAQGQPTDQNMTYVTGAASSFFSSAASGLDVNYDGKTNETLHGHDEWEGSSDFEVSPGLDLQQVSAVGTVSTVGLGGEAGALKPAGGGGALKPAGGGGALKPAGGGGALKPAGGGGALKPAGGGGLKTDITHENANSYTRPPRSLTATEAVSPRVITLNWTLPTFGQIVQYNVYRAVTGSQFQFLASVVPVAPATTFPPTTYQDNASCNTNGYTYEVTAFVLNDVTQQPQESLPSNVVSVAGLGTDPLTACYTSSSINLTSPSNGVHGDIVPITWSLSDDFYSTNGPVTRVQANTSLVAHGPLPNNCGVIGDTAILSNGVKTAISGASSLSVTSGGTFTFSWDTDAFCAGSYTFKLSLDSAQTQTTASPLQLSIDINDQDTPRINPLALPVGTVGLAYPTTTLTEDGGTAPFKWSITGLPNGISQQTLFSPTISGTTCAAAGSYPVGATVSDSATPANTGMQGFTLQINKATTTTSVSSDVNPSVFQQLLTFTVTVAPQYSCTPTGTVTLYDGQNSIGSSALTNGKATFALANLPVGNHSITASYGGDNSFNSSVSGLWSQTVNRANTQIVVNSVSPSTIFVGQPITVSYSLSVVPLGAGSPIAPTGNITVTASDGSACAPQPASSGMCTLSPPPTAAGSNTFTVTYSGDGNFFGTAFPNVNYTVYQLVFTAQPSNTGVGLTAPAVQVTAEDSSNNTLTTFIGGITVAIGSGPGTLSGTLTQNAIAGVATFGDLSINKIANGYTLTASPSGGVPDATSNAFNIDTFYVDSQGNFGTLDLATGTATQIGAATVPGSTGIDLTPNLQLYAYSTSNQLMQINPSTGAATPVGSAGSIPDQATTGALTDGSYFGIDAVTGNLYSINLTTGATTSVGATSAAVLPAGCTVEASLTGSASALYYTIGYSGASCSAPMPDTLYQINPTNGLTTTIGQVTISGSGVNAFIGSTFVGGKLYGFTSDGKEYAISPATAVATLVTNTTTPILAAASSQ